MVDHDEEEEGEEAGDEEPRGVGVVEDVGGVPGEGGGDEDRISVYDSFLLDTLKKNNK